ncbi:MAG: ComEA family DNA-binding protein [Acidimicrobiia bacterium]
MTITLGAWWWSSSPSGDAQPVVAEPTFVVDEEEPAPAILHVHVAGEVRRPGVVRLVAGSRIVDAIEAAGGATPAAVLAGVNLASEVLDGAQIVVPSSSVGPVPAVDNDGVVVVNRATLTELESLPGVGPVLAERILAHRDEHGPFEAVEDLLDVSGIGEATLARLRPLIRIP